MGRESPDPRTKVGCVIVAPDGSLLCTACNNYPHGIAQDNAEHLSAPSKYVWIEHAERNAIYKAARQGLSTAGSTLVVELPPCVDCARAIIQAGISQAVINEERSAEYNGEQYSSEHPIAEMRLAEAGVLIRHASPLVT
jgi:dCMP deaminase